MLEYIPWISLAALVGLAIGWAISHRLIRRQDRLNLSSAQNQAKDLIAQAQKNAENALKDAELKAKDEFFKKRDEFNREVEQAKNEQREQERRLQKREDNLEQSLQAHLKKSASYSTANASCTNAGNSLKKKSRNVEAQAVEQTHKLHQLSGLSREQAEQLLLERLDRELADEIAARIHKHEEGLKVITEETAHKILASAIQRYAAEHTADTTVSSVDIPSDDIKGRIIGREGRNIRTFEKATGVDVIVDDTPGVVIVSAFDNIRREIAKLALTKLIQDGRIHPTRIEEVVKETQGEMERYIMETGKQTALDANIGPLHEKLVQLLGRLKFRTSYSQNVLQHSLEVAYLCGLMADEMGLNGLLARRCGLLHDIGKAADHEMEGGHPKIGAELAKRYGETSKEVLHAIVGHHDEVTTDHVYTVLVAAADAISASRPGIAVKPLKSMSNGSKSLRHWPRAFLASNMPTPSRPAANCASSPTPASSPTAKL